MRVQFARILRARGTPAPRLPRGGLGRINEMMFELCSRPPADTTRSQALLAQARTAFCPFFSS